VRIGLVCDHFPPRAVGGAEWSVAALADLLAPDLERLVVAVTADVAAGRQERATLRIERFRPPLGAFSRRGALRPWALANPWFTLRTAARLCRLGSCERLDLLHAQAHASLPAAVLAARRLRVPVVATLRDTRTLCEPAVCLHRLERVPADCGHAKLVRECADEFLDRAGAPRGRLRRWRRKAEFSWLWWDNRLRWWCLRRCDAVVGVSAAILDVYSGRRILDPRRSRLAVIRTPPPAPPADAPGRRRDTRRRLGLDERPLVLYLGKHSAGKGTATLRRAWEKVAPRFPGATLMMAGAGHPAADLPGLRVTGPISHDEALELALAADVVVSPSVAPEALSRSLVEAAGFGRPVIGTRAGGTPELVRHGYNGLLAERGDAGSLAGALVDFLGDPHLAADLARGQQEVRATFLAPAAIRDAHLDLYRSLLGIQPGSTARPVQASPGAPAPDPATRASECHFRGKSARRKEAS